MNSMDAAKQRGKSDGGNSAPSRASLRLGSGLQGGLDGPFSADLTPALWYPDRLVSPPSWVSHIPFAFWLVSALRPRLLVELGTCSGNSYSAFCQAVKHLELDCTCFGLARGPGDEHAGGYSDTVHQEFSTYHDVAFGGFSTLIRSTLDEAWPGFEDGTIDLLHVDGMRGYEAAGHAYESWRPKLSSRAVVLFHGSNVREREFGVAKLWRELAARHPHFEFPHGCGLGVLGVGDALPETMRGFFAASQMPDVAQALRGFFSRLGLPLEDRARLAALDRQGALGPQTNSGKLQTVASAGQARHDDVAALAAECARLEVELQRQRELALNSETERRVEAATIGELERFNAALLGEIERMRDAYHRISARLREAEAERDHVHGRLAAIEDSTTWKLGHPVRRSLENAPGLRRWTRRAAKAAWWTATGQIGRRLAERRALLQPELPASPAPPPTARDRCALVPFAYDVRHITPPSRVAVVCHVFYPELADEMRRYLGNIPFEADIFVSTESASKKAVIERSFADWRQGTAEVRVMPNRGRDIAPKLVGYSDVHDRYEFVLHLHSKQSRHQANLGSWRGFLLESLVGSPEVVRSIFAAFARDLHLGMVAPPHIAEIRDWIIWGGNFDTGSELARKLDIPMPPDELLDFPSGSMFWARTAALRPLLDLGLSFEDFPAESGQTDGTLAHAMERLYFLVCERAGFRWMKAANRRVHHSAGAVEIDSPAALDRFLAEGTLISAQIEARARAMASPGPYF